MSFPGLVQIYKALGHPARLRIVAMLRKGELCACQITAVLDLAPSTVSAHLAELRRAGLIAERKDGRWVYYSLGTSEDVAEISGRAYQRVRRDRQIRRDAAMVKDLRAVPVEEFCRSGLDASRVEILLAGKS
jgi:arsenate reductase/ArsR family transcriptional regulator